MSHAARLAGRTATAARTPFVLLIVGLLGGGLVCLLVLNTILAQGSYRMTSLQQQNVTLVQRQQELQQQIDKAETDNALAAQAKALGMVPVNAPAFVDLRTGRTVSGYGRSGR